jgi:serine O-acetyltransferase
MKTKFITSLNSKQLSHFVSKQINSFYPDNNIILAEEILPSCKIALKRLEYCFIHIKRKYYSCDQNSFFNHLHSDHYAMFLYLLSNTSFKLKVKDDICSKLFLLNKALHGIDVFYSVELPKVFLFIHPVGTILGNAHYGNYFVVYQNCSVGALSETGEYPTFGDGVVLYSRTSILGPCKIGKNVYFGANSGIISINVPSNSTVVGIYPHHKILQNTKPIKQNIFHIK